MADSAQQRIVATVERITFRNEANGYTVLEANDGEDDFTAVGPMPRVGEGERVEFEGVWTEHRDYGRQFSISRCRPSVPQGANEIERFLASGLIRGCGPATARAIVKRFGEDTATILEFAPHRLQEVAGIGSVIAQRIAESYRENMDMRAVIAGLSDYGVTIGQAIRIAKEYGTDGVALVRENPYRLAEDIFGIGFKTADNIAMQMGIEKDAPPRIAAGLRHALTLASGEGHTYLPSKILCEYAAKQLGVTLDLVKRTAARMVQTGELFIAPGEDEPVYSRTFYFIENECAARLYALCRASAQALCTDVDAALAHQQQRAGIALSDKQIQAVQTGIEAPLSVITGGPGTGKTTIVQFMLSVFERAGLGVALCAPTGRAAKRITEATGREAKTIHRLLEYGRGDTIEEEYGRNEDNPLPAAVVIVDEMSMVDVFLMTRLLRAIRPGARLVLIGDADQLPSVGPGHVLHDIIQCGVVPVVELDTVYRQGEGSSISLNAQRINRGQLPEPDGKEVVVIPCEDAAGIWRAVEGIAKEHEAQIITPMRKGAMGVHALNENLQALCNPPAGDKAQLPAPWRPLRRGDKVMQIKNDYRMAWERDDGVFHEKGLGVFNGELGIIADIDLLSLEASVVFDDGRVARYEFARTDTLELAYAISIHKSQGSEFESVVIVLAGGPPMLYTRNLLYTAVTRAKKRLFIVGKRSALAQMVHNNRTRARYSGLRAALGALCNPS
jgi:exodeoxyribonuclease V alpha subunit